MTTEMLQLSTPDGPMRAYLASPDAGPRSRGVVVIQEAFGLNDHIEDVTRRFAAARLTAIAPELYHRCPEPGPVAYDDLPGARECMQTMTDDAMLTDVDASIAHLAGLGIAATATGIVGFCMGGRVAFLTALRRPIGAAVTFYGGGLVHARLPQLPALVGEAASLQTPWLGLFGDRDGSIPVEEVEEVRTAAVAAVADTAVVRYAEAGHGFFCDLRPSYAPDAAADAWARTLAWFERLEPR